MTDIRSAVQPATALAPERTHGDNTPQPVRSLRDWLDHLAARDRLTVVRPGTALRFELAAVAKRLDGRRAALFRGRAGTRSRSSRSSRPRLDGGGDGRRPAGCSRAPGRRAQSDPVADDLGAGTGGRAPRDQSRAAASTSDPQRARPAPMSPPA
jgi:hypothetical protein